MFGVTSPVLDWAVVSTADCLTDAIESQSKVRQVSVMSVNTQTRPQQTDVVTYSRGGGLPTVSPRILLGS